MVLDWAAMGCVDGAALHSGAWSDGLALPPDQTVSEWADAERVLSKVSSAEAGRYRTDRTPYLREIMDCLSPSSPVQHVVVRKGAQVGATELGNNWLGFLIDRIGGACLVVLPTVDVGKRWSRQRLAPMLRDTPALHGKVKDARSRDSGNTVLQKEFDGGLLIITGANSGVGLRSMPCAYLMFDEVDGYPEDVDGEGHPIDVAAARAATFPFRKTLEVSTPKVAHASRIDADFRASDEAYYYVPCPECDGMQTLEADRLVYPDEDPSACQGMACLHCGAIIPHSRKTWMMARGEWWRRIGENEYGPRDVLSGRSAGFHISAMMSPIGWMSWADVAKAKEAARKDESAAKTYANLILGLPFEEQSDAPEWEVLYRRRLTYPIGTVPVGAYLLTAGMDVQRDRVEVAWWGWGEGMECWLVDHEVIEGDTARDDVWSRCTDAAARVFAHAEGSAQLPADLVAIDMQYETEAVKSWVLAQRSGRVIAVQGRDAWGAPVVIGRSETNKEPKRAGKRRGGRGFPFWAVSSSSAKLEIYRRFRRRPNDDESPPWGGPHIHLPQVSREFCEQLVAERLQKRAMASRRAGVNLEWIKVRDRNEALDLLVYAMACAYRLRADRMSESHWAKLRARWNVGAAKAPAKPKSQAAPLESAQPQRQQAPAQPARKLSRGIRL